MLVRTIVIGRTLVLKNPKPIKGRPKRDYCYTNNLAFFSLKSQLSREIRRRCFNFPMASSSIANSLGKRKPEDDLDTEPVLRRHKSEAKETRSESQVELLETKYDESALNSAMV